MKNIFTLCLVWLAALSSQANEIFQEVTLPEKDLHINSIAFDGDLQLWIGAEEGLWVLNNAGNSLSLFKPEDLPSTHIKHLHFSNSAMWASTADGHLLEWASGKWTTHETPKGSYTYISYVTEHKNQLFLGTDNGKVFVGTPAGGYTEKNYSSAALGEITHIGITSFATIATLSTNGVMLDFTGQGFTLPIKAESSALPSNNVISGFMYNDVSYDCTDKGLYLADFSGGGPPSLELITASSSTIPSNVVQTAWAQNGIEWIGTDKGLARRTDGTWDQLTEDNSDLFEGDITKVIMDRFDRLWFTTASGRLGTMSGTVSAEKPLSRNPELKVYPTLVVDQFTVDAELDNDEAVSISLWSLDGRKVRSLFEGHSQKTALQSFDISSESKGIYLVKMETLSGTTSTRIIKQ